MTILGGLRIMNDNIRFIYRVEGETGCGPFQRCQNTYIEGRDRLGDFIYGKVGCKPCHITPDKDWSLWDEWGHMGYDDVYYFGFDNLDQLLEWFDYDDLSKFKQFEDDNFKFKISKYKASNTDIIFGDYQLLFIKDNAKLIERIEPDELRSHINNEQR